MKNFMVLIIICVAVFACIYLLGSCRRTQAQETAYRKISAAKARQMMAETKDYIILDVRTEAEYREKRIEGAVLIPDNEIDKRAEKELPDKNQLIFVYCRSGRRSENASRILVRQGFTNVYDLGGIMNWPYETIGD